MALNKQRGLLVKYGGSTGRRFHAGILACVLLIRCLPANQSFDNRALLGTLAAMAGLD